jgi:hypothetical protein
VGEPGRIRTSTSLVLLAFSAASCLACAKGTEISPAEIVILQVLPPELPDAGADAAAASEGAADPAAPAASDTEP